MGWEGEGGDISDVGERESCPALREDEKTTVEEEWEEEEEEEEEGEGEEEKESYSISHSLSKRVFWVKESPHFSHPIFLPSNNKISFDIFFGYLRNVKFGCQMYILNLMAWLVRLAASDGLVYFPLFCMIIVVLLCPTVSYFLHWENVLRTHCKVPQFWPSMSSVIGNNTPGEKVCWIKEFLSMFWLLFQRTIYLANWSSLNFFSSLL